MKIIISPAKSLDFKTKAPTTLHTLPDFLEQSAVLNKRLKGLSRKQLSELMKISDNLADLNYQRNQEWELPFSTDNSKQAVYTFTGDVYRGLDITSLPEDKIPHLQDTLRILSGLYGLLKPLDLIQPYRLEMGTKLSTGTAKNLYEFWGNTLVSALNNEMKPGELLINLASNEYSKSIPKKELKAPLITPVFKELRGDAYKIIAIYAKKARGLMTRFIIENNCQTIDDIKAFNDEKYLFDANLSTETELVFTR